MAKKDLRLEPYDLDKNVWWYEESKGIELHVETVYPSGQRDHHSYIIPWVQLRSALKRKDA